MRIDIPVIGEFIREHGGNPILKPGSTRRYLLPDGASYDESDFETYMAHDPPDDPIECCRLKHLYHKTKFEQVRKDYRQLRAALMGRTDEYGFAIMFGWPKDGRYGPDPEDAPVALRLLHGIVVKHHDAVAELEAEYQRLTAKPETTDSTEPERPYVDERLQAALAETVLDYAKV